MMRLFASFVFFLSTLFLNSALFANRTLLVADKARAQIYLFDTETFSERARIPVAALPHEITVSPSGKIALVTHYGHLPFTSGKRISVIDVQKGERISEIFLGEGADPHGIAFVNETRAICTEEKSQSLWSITINNPETPLFKQYAELPGKGAHMVTVDQKGQFAYVTNNQSGDVVKINLETPTDISHRNIGKTAEGMALTQDGKTLLVTNRKDHTLWALNTEDLSERWGPIETNLKGPIRVALYGDDAYAGITSLFGGKVEVISTENGDRQRRFDPVGNFETPKPLLPIPITILSYEDSTAFVANSFTGDPIRSGHVALVDLATGNILTTIKAGIEPDGMALSQVETGDPAVNEKLRELEKTLWPKANHLNNQPCDQDGFCKHASINTYTVINKPKNKVWEVLTDFENFEHWNSFMFKARATEEGQKGATIHVKAHIFPLNIFGGTFHISERVENDTLCWEGDIIGVSAKRCFKLVELEEGKTLYYTYDRFGGKSAPRVWEMMGQKVKTAFEAEAVSLKEEVETGREPAI